MNALPSRSRGQPSPVPSGERSPRPPLPLGPDRASASEARLTALEARLAVVEARAATAETALALAQDLGARVTAAEAEIAGRVDEDVIGRAEAAKLMGMGIRQFSRLARREPALMACWFRAGSGPRARLRFVRRKLLAYRDSRG